MTKSCPAYFSFTEQIRTSKSRSAQRRWPSTAMSSESSTRFARSESRRSAIRLGRLLPPRLEVLHHRLEVLPRHRRPNLRFLSDRGLVLRTRVIFPRREPCGLVDFFPQAQARQKFVGNPLEQKSGRIRIHAPPAVDQRSVPQ